MVTTQRIHLLPITTLLSYSNGHLNHSRVVRLTFSVLLLQYSTTAHPCAYPCESALF